MNEEQLSTPLLVLVAAILITQGTILFVQAKKRNRAAWLWGLAGLIQFPWPSIVFWFFIIRPEKKKQS